MSDDDMNKNREAGSEYEPVIDRLREIAARGRRAPQGGQADQAMGMPDEWAGSQDGQMMSKQALEAMQQWMISHPEVMSTVMDWMHKGDMIEQPILNSTAEASIPGMPPPQTFEDGSTPYTRLQARVNRIGRGNASSTGNGTGAG